MIYLVVLTILVGFSIAESSGVFKYKKYEGIIGYYFLLIILTLFAGLRFRVGGDTLAYIRYFSSMPTVDQLASFDYFSAMYNPFWYFFNAIIKFIRDDYYFFQIAHAFIINSVIFWFIKKNTENKFLTILFYYIFYYTYFNMEILRESLAAAVFLLGYKYLLNKDWKKYYIISIVCILIHSSGLILLVLPFFYRKFNVKIFYIILSLAFLISFLNVFELLSFLNFSYQLRYKMNSYLNSEINIFGMLMLALLILPTLFVHLLRNKNGMPKHRFENNVSAYLFIGVLAMVIGGFYRFLNYIAIINLIYVVDSIVALKKGKIATNAIWANLILISLFTYQFYYLYRDTSKYERDTRFYVRYYPYHSVFDPKVEKKRENQYYNMMNLNW